MSTSKPANIVSSKECKKSEEKLKQKAEKEAKKVNRKVYHDDVTNQLASVHCQEEKRLVKEEERLAKLRAKEEKKRGKCEAKALLVANT